MYALALMSLAAAILKLPHAVERHQEIQICILAVLLLSSTYPLAAGAIQLSRGVPKSQVMRSSLDPKAVFATIATLLSVICGVVSTVLALIRQH